LDQELDVTLGHATRAVELARSGVHELVVPALAALAYANYLAGDSSAARAAAEEATSHSDAPLQQHGFIHARAMLALLECEAGHPQTAEAAARETVVGAR